MDLYFLKHKDMRVAILSFDDDYQVKHIGIETPEHLPNLGHQNTKMIRDWLSNRAAPDARDDMEEAKKGSGCHSTRELLVKNLALSLSDCYWICPADEERSWDEVKLYDKDTSVHFYEQSDRIFSGNISLGGNMPKQWKLDEEKNWCIYKTCENGCINQTINEVFASEISAKQKTALDAGVTYTPYHFPNPGETDTCICPAFTDDGTEFVSAFECLCSRKVAGSESLYDVYLDILKEHGLSEKKVQPFLDYQTMLDFVISNTDRHLSNFGVLRNPDSLTFLSMAPIFDNGNSMSYDDNIRRDKRTALDIKIHGFFTKEINLLKRVKDKKILDLSKLPKKKTVKDFYISHGVDEHVADRVAHNYDIKVSLADDFQHGKKLTPQ